MGRRVRLFFKDTALHILVSGINDTKIFKEEEDYKYYTEVLKELSDIMHVDIHSYSLCPSSVHLLCTFGSKDDLVRFMQSLGLKYVSYFNKKYNRSGTIWQGRYKSSYVEDKYILYVMSYIEKSCSSMYSSFQANSFGICNALLKKHEMYNLLGKDDKDRSEVYKKNFIDKDIDKNIINFIEDHLKRQTVTGSKEFYKKLESIVGEPLGRKKRGRPKKYKNQSKKKGKVMFGKLVVLDKEKHKDLKINPMTDLEFARDLTFIPLLANEVAAVGEMFPVVFSSDKMPKLVALTSLGGKNLAINSEGKYISRYVPAFLRKYPFALAKKDEESDEKVILIDEDAKVFSKTKGKQLFSKDGAETEVLKNAIHFLQEWDKQHQNTEAVLKTIEEADILEEREISIGEGEDKKILIKGFKVVNREKMNNLDDATLATWVRKGIISFVDAHLNSLSKIDTLFKIASQVEQN